MRIGTWNLEGRWGKAQQAALEGADCAVWLLTEVPTSMKLEGFTVHRGLDAKPGRAWAAVAVHETLPVTGSFVPHGASAAVVVADLTFCSSVLPWRSCGGDAPWEGEDTTSRVAAAVDSLVDALPTGKTVWGGDWNHSLEGRETSGSLGGREHLERAVRRLGLDVATRDLPHRLDGVGSIDHVAVPTGTRVLHAARRVEMMDGGRHLSDHDAYVVDVALSG